MCVKLVIYKDKVIVIGTVIIKKTKENNPYTFFCYLQ